MTPTTTDRGIALPIWKLQVGDLVWHRGQYRPITAINGPTIRMGRYAIRPGFHTMEVLK
jgi:hypothetical protein